MPKNALQDSHFAGIGLSAAIHFTETTTPNNPMDTEIIGR